MKWAVFDLEFTALLPDLLDDDPLWAEHVRVACGAIMTTDDSWPRVYYEASAFGPADALSRITLEAFIDALASLHRRGYAVATWGGTASDWRILAKECPHRRNQIQAMALSSVDIPFCSCMQLGMMMGLNAACKALGWNVKGSEDSRLVPQKWANFAERQSVLQHVCNDAYATMMVLRHAEMTRQLPWITQKGIHKVWYDVRFWTVHECLQRELPSVPFQVADNMNAKKLARWLMR